MRIEAVTIAALATITSCKCKTGESTASPPGGIQSGPPTLADKPSYRVDVGPATPCKAGDPCTARIVLTALGDYHVNEQYPTKLIPDPSPAVALSPGSFALDSAKAGTLTIPFRVNKPGTYKITGTFKLCVCTDKDCEVESPKITFEVTAT